jgi:predicted nucleic acid-binding protein
VVSLWVVNASPIILLAKVGLVDLLRQLGPAFVIPGPVVREIQRRGPADAAVQALAQAAWLLSVDPGPIPPAVSAFGLGDGESGVLAHALANPGSGAIIDDQGARNAAAALAIPHQGTLGVVLDGKMQGLIAAARPVIEQLRQEGMYLSDALMNTALAQVGE